ncbi:hypothetical protein W97_05554 [Coniosporium apollinis CBS 100218]|uniref:ML-like domain-containing protein n=1 Tax=Coniosporium apollinis (strain CBS 100218) TaxID=1168221 RepID=R7YXQ6_CONA1|nr:uncharacterized protein W97_05554 [Coniosporium apollinis CBS 100218]EON66456.1 hypothetical protein W97_05554 [Coniosporium apollinis CBS 100218]
MATTLRASRATLLLILAVLSLLHVSLAQDASDIQWITTVDANGNKLWLQDNRRPSLYTADFGDCMGSSTVNVTRFDAAYYKDNMTVTFHLAGNTGLRNESLMMYIGVFAYGESHFDLTFNPCNANIYSMCPMNAGVPIEANGIIPINSNDVAGIPPIALSIPDFEGQAILRIFSNTTQTQIGCYSAVVTNGNTFSHPKAVGSVLGIFTFVAMLASFAMAIYGQSVPTMRKHYAHSLSVLVVFAVFQHIFFTGALSMNWPSVLVAFWSNYAWAGGMIYTRSMQNSINNFIGSNKGNTTAVGAASSGALNEDLGGGYDISKIYKRSELSSLMSRSVLAGDAESRLAKRALANSTEGFKWYGNPVPPGLPLPGNYSGFAGTLGQQKIPASNAFLTGLIWLLILVGLIAASVAAFKWIVEGLIRVKLVKNSRLPLFRSHWLGYTAMAVLRTLFIAFFMIIFLCLFQFTYDGAAGVIAVAAIVFVIFLIGMFGIAAYACYYRIRVGNYVSQPDRVNLERRKALGFVPWYSFSRASEHQDDGEKVYTGSMPFWRVSQAEAATAKSVHDDEDYTEKFGWLASRFRRTRWWFFVVWLLYEFIRACFYGGASGHPMTQVFGLLVVEFITFVAIIVMRPFEGQRLNALVVYLLGFSKVATVALSAAFDIRFSLARIPTTVIGVVIIVIQGVLTVVLLIAIVAGAISSYMSLTRNREDFRPRRWQGMRERYFRHIEGAATDLPPPPPPVVVEEEAKVGFNVTSIRRVAKIEDEDREFVGEINGDPAAMASSAETGNNTNDANEAEAGPSSPSASPPPVGVPHRTRSRAGSVRSQRSHSNIPYGARVHRASWSTRDFEGVAAEGREDVARLPSPQNNASRPRSRAPSDAVQRSPSAAGNRPVLRTLHSEVEVGGVRPVEKASS